MSDQETVDFITANIEAILTGLPLDFETSFDATTTPTCSLQYNGDDMDDNFNEAPVYNIANYSIQVKAKSTAGSDRTIRSFWIHTLKDALNVAALNVGGLLSSKLVTRVNHDGQDTDRISELTSIDYAIGVKYRAA